MESQILAQVSQVSGLNLVTFDAECRQTICRIRLFYPPGTNALSSSERLKPLAGQLGFDHAVQAATIAEDGVPMSLLYLQRERGCMIKDVLSAAAIVLTFAIFVPYIRSIRQGQTKPHVFSWVIWGLSTFVVFLAQLAGSGGVGAWPIGVSGVITAYIAVLAYRKQSDTAITRSDWAFFAVALAALPCWFFTSDPLWAVVILTGLDLAGFGPTFRSAYARPHDERIALLLPGRSAQCLVGSCVWSTTR